MTTMSTMLVAVALADPCGMVPPIWTGQGPAPVGIERTGLQQTYVFHRDGVQTIAIRPGFTGSVEEFGMLVPLPAVPALRKIDDRTFLHLAAAVDPPPFTVHVLEDQPYWGDADMPMAEASAAMDDGLTLGRSEVRVVKEEAVGMYEVAVLEAGSSQALRRWMDRHRFRYPDGMDETVDDYVDEGWMFVAIKTRVAEGGGVAPQPGMRSVDDGLPSGASFDGYVQGMAFRFEVDEPVVPMRLSTFNGDDTHNRVYVLSEGPVRIREVSDSLVRRQVRCTATSRRCCRWWSRVPASGSPRRSSTAWTASATRGRTTGSPVTCSPATCWPRRVASCPCRSRSGRRSCCASTRR
jgi:hypothetical protein